MGLDYKAAVVYKIPVSDYNLFFTNRTNTKEVLEWFCYNCQRRTASPLGLFCEKCGSKWYEKTFSIEETFYEGKVTKTVYPELKFPDIIVYLENEIEKLGINVRVDYNKCIYIYFSKYNEECDGRIYEAILDIEEVTNICNKLKEYGMEINTKSLEVKIFVD